MDIRAVLLLIVVIKIGQSANILCVYSTVSHSHFLFAETLLVELSRRGHNVSVVSQYARPMPIDTYKAIVIPPNEGLKRMMKMFTDNVGDQLIVLTGLLKIGEVHKDIMRQTMELEGLQKIIREGNVDLLITETMIGDNMLGLAFQLNCPNIQISSFPAVLEFFRRMGNPMSLSYVPNSYLSSSSEPMGFVTRVTHFVTGLLEKLVFTILTDIISSIHQEHFPYPEYPTIYEMRNNVSLLITNSHFSQGIVRPLVPGIIEVSGMHVSPPVALPKDLDKLMNDSSNGVILFSLGTNVKSSSVPEHKIQILLSTFRNLKETVLWKFDNDQIKLLPANVKIFNWLPQNDLLAHPNLKLFISHGGLGSIIEAKYHGVPLVLMPVFGDQIGNSEQVVSEGWGRSLEFDKLTAENFQEAVHDVLTNSSYKERIQNLSQLYRDRPQSAMDTAVYWVEYIIRYNGAPHIRSNARLLNFFQYHSIDVIGFLFITLLIMCSVIYMLAKLVFKVLCKLCRRNKVKND